MHRDERVTDAMVGVAAKLELWFFRDMFQSNRLALFSLFGFKNADLDTMGKQQKVFRHIISSLSAALSEQTLPVRVKALTWEPGVVDYAKPLPGMKYVACSTTPPGAWAWWLDSAPETRAVHPSEEAAKASAQQDYETRIRSAIVDVPAVEPVAEPDWWLVATDMGKVIFHGHDKDRAERVSEIQGRPVTPLYAHPPRSALVDNSHASEAVVETWQPIETVPRDGTTVLLVGGVYGGLPFPGKWDKSEFVSPVARWFSSINKGHLYNHVATHWMPLPAPPALSSLRPAEVGSATETSGAGE